ncbi:hypothetical protein JM654_12645 [Microbacterium oxydans]|nr:hypothetical protein [Microbacterium oxydans]
MIVTDRLLRPEHHLHPRPRERRSESTRDLAHLFALRGPPPVPRCRDAYPQLLREGDLGRLDRRGPDALLTHERHLLQPRHHQRRLRCAAIGPEPERRGSLVERTGEERADAAVHEQIDLHPHGEGRRERTGERPELTEHGHVEAPGEDHAEAGERHRDRKPESRLHQSVARKPDVAPPDQQQHLDDRAIGLDDRAVLVPRDERIGADGQDRSIGRQQAERTIDVSVRRGAQCAEHAPARRTGSTHGVAAAIAHDEPAQRDGGIAELIACIRAGGPVSQDIEPGAHPDPVAALGAQDGRESSSPGPVAPVLLIERSRPQRGRIDGGYCALHERPSDDERAEAGDPMMRASARIETSQPCCGLRSESGAQGRGAGDETCLVLGIAHGVSMRLGREQQRTVGLSGLGEPPGEPRESRCGGRGSLE